MSHAPTHSPRLLFLALAAALVALMPCAVAVAQQAPPAAELPQGSIMGAGPGPQQPPPPGQRGGQRGPVDGSQALGRFFYSPMQVLGQADEIGLTSEQEAAVRDLMGEHQERFRQLRFDLGNEMTRLGALAVDHPVDEATIMQQLETVLGLEAEIKRLQLSMLVRVKNLLTPDQQAQLRTFGSRFGSRSEPPQRERGPRPLR
jgi:Spy/CpxP family protein refolding chaperone